MSDVLQNIALRWSEFDPMVALMVFFAYCVLDALIAKYTIEVASLDEYRAATTGVISHFLLAFGVINYTQNWLYVFPLVAGSWIGTFYYVRRARIKKITE
jgi:hypothetical protein